MSDPISHVEPAEPGDIVTDKGRGDRIARRIVVPLIFVGVALALVYLFFSPLRIAGDSMEPSLSDADRVLRDKHVGEAERGDIVVIDVGTSSTRDDVVKRVVAVAGDTVEVRDDVVWVNSVRETNDVIRVPSAGVSIGPLVVPEGGVFVMGDNRPVSLDSRFVGPLPASKVRGRVVFVFLPLNDLGRPH